jgi:hypothetical protein
MTPGVNVKTFFMSLNKWDKIAILFAHGKAFQLSVVSLSKAKAHLSIAPEQCLSKGLAPGLTIKH